MWLCHYLVASMEEECGVRRSLDFFSGETQTSSSRIWSMIDGQHDLVHTDCLIGYKLVSHIGEQYLHRDSTREGLGDFGGKAVAKKSKRS